MRRLTNIPFIAVAVCTVGLVSTAALAQEVAATATAGGAAKGGEADGGTDHSKVVGKIGIGYFGAFAVPTDATKAEDTVHLVGMRYWLTEKMGITAALGLKMTSGNKSTAGTSTDDPSYTTFALRGGVPLAVADSKHMTIFIQPELFIGMASGTIKTPNQADTKTSGSRIVLGASAGAEVHFGFIGLPNLALDATVGLGVDAKSGTTTPPSPAAENKFSSTTISTIAGHQPWNIFHTNVAATYYF